MLVFVNENQAVIQQEDGMAYGYANSPLGRKRLAETCTPDMAERVSEVWGKYTTVTDETPQPQEDVPAGPGAPTLEERTQALESAMLAVMMGGNANA